MSDHDTPFKKPKLYSRRQAMGYFTLAGMGLGAGSMHYAASEGKAQVAKIRETYSAIEPIRRMLEEVESHVNTISGRLVKDLRAKAATLEESLDSEGQILVRYGLLSPEDNARYKQIIRETENYENLLDLNERVERTINRINARVLAWEDKAAEKVPALQRLSDTVGKAWNATFGDDTGVKVPVGQESVEARKRNLRQLTTLLEVYDAEDDSLAAQSATVDQINGLLNAMADDMSELSEEERQASRVVYRRILDAAKADPKADQDRLRKQILAEAAKHELAGLQNLQEHIILALDQKRKVDNYARMTHELQSQMRQYRDLETELETNYNVSNARLRQINERLLDITTSTDAVLADLRSMHVKLNQPGFEYDPMTQSLQSLEDSLDSWWIPAAGAVAGGSAAVTAYNWQNILIGLSKIPAIGEVIRPLAWLSTKIRRPLHEIHAEQMDTAMDSMISRGTALEEENTRLRLRITALEKQSESPDASSEEK